VTTLLLVRHGETDWNADGRLQGHTDRPLSEFGRRQARQLAEELADEELDAIYASDLSRARETAQVVGARLGLAAVLDPDLREKDWGTWEGLTAVEREQVELAGESTEAHKDRVLGALKRIAERHPGGRVLVDPDLREKNWGNWEGLTSDERLHIEFEGETSEAHRDRTLRAVQRIVERHPDERIVVVTHGGSLRRIQAAVSGFALPVIENCAVWGLTHEDGRFRPID